MSNSCSDCAPLVIVEADLSAHVITNDLLKTEKNTATLFSSSFTNKENYVVIEGTSKGIPGEGKVGAVIDGTEGDDIEIDVEERFTEDLKLGIKSLPIILDKPQDLFIIYNTEGEVITDEEIPDLVISTNPEIDIYEIKEVGSVKVVNGLVTKDVAPDGEVTITALATGIESSKEKIDSYDNKLRNILVDHPPTVRSNEPFPFVVFATDEMNNPIEIVEATISPDDSFSDGGDGLKKLSNTDTTKLVVFKDGMTPATSQIDVIAHKVSLNVSPPSKLKLGKPHNLSVKVQPVDALVTLDTKLDYEKSENGFKLIPVLPGDYVVRVIASAEGFSSVTETFQVNVAIDNPLSPESNGQSDSPNQNLLFEGIGSLPIVIVILVAAGAGGFVVFKKSKGNTKSENSDSKKSANDIDFEEDLTF